MAIKINFLVEELRRARRKMGLSQKRVAEFMDIGRPTYTKYECGNVEPSLKGSSRLRLLLNISSDEVLDIMSDGDLTKSVENPTVR